MKTKWKMEFFLIKHFPIQLHVSEAVPRQSNNLKSIFNLLCMFLLEEEMGGGRFQFICRQIQIDFNWIRLCEYQFSIALVFNIREEKYWIFENYLGRGLEVLV